VQHKPARRTGKTACRSGSGAERGVRRHWHRAVGLTCFEPATALGWYATLGDERSLVGLVVANSTIHRLHHHQILRHLNFRCLQAPHSQLEAIRNLARTSRFRTCRRQRVARCMGQGTAVVRFRRFAVQGSWLPRPEARDQPDTRQPVLGYSWFGPEKKVVCAA
jgi:hypothetical protein